MLVADLHDPDDGEIFVAIAGQNPAAIRRMLGNVEVGLT
jgi:serine phosphatase RsbU (regulator of sigma subunit)